jgi:hypothetical protein
MRRSYCTVTEKKPELTQAMKVCRFARKIHPEPKREKNLSDTFFFSVFFFVETTCASSGYEKHWNLCTYRFW